MQDSKGIPLVWFGNLEGEKKEQFKQALLHDTLVLGRLKEIIDSYLEAIEAEEVSDKHFSTPDWSTREAFLLGRKRSLREIRRLIWL